MNPKIDGTSARVRLLQSDPTAYFEKLLLELDELEKRIAKDDDASDAGPTPPGPKSQ
jgi:hypothetical protein